MVDDRQSWTTRFLWPGCAVIAAALLLFFSGAVNSLLGQTELSSPESLSSDLRAKLEQKGDLMLRDVTVVEAMFIIQQKWNVNIVVGNDMKDPVNGSYENAPLHEILDTLLGSRGYGYRVVGNSLVVMKQEEIAEQKPLFKTERIALHHVPPEEVTDLIDFLLSPGGRAHAVASARSVIVMDYPDRIEQIRARLEELDAAAADAEQADEVEAEQATQHNTSRHVDPVGATDNVPDNDVETPADSGTPEAENPAPENNGTGSSAEAPPTTTETPTTGNSATTQNGNTAAPSNAGVLPGPNNAETQASPATTSGATNDPLLDVPLLETRIFRLQYAEADTIVTSLATLVSEFGQVTAIAEENRIVAIDDRDHLTNIANTIRLLDTPRDQVRISAIIFDASLEDLRDIGINLTYVGRGNNLTAAGGPQDQVTLGTLLSPTPGANAVNTSLTLMSLSQNVDLTTVIRLLKESNKSQLLTDPNIVVQDRESARIRIVTEIPYQQLTESAQGGAIGTTAFREAGVTLEVTPRIAADGTVNLVVTPSFSVLTGFTENDNQPIIATREATTVVRVSDQQTLVLGGLRQRSRVRDRASMPYISSVPVVGALFRRRSDEIRESELVVFLTPTIITPEHFGTSRERCILETGQCELDKIQQEGCERCRPPEDPRIYTNYEMGTSPVYVDQRYMGPQPPETIDDQSGANSQRSESNLRDEETPIRLPAVRRGNPNTGPNTTPQNSNPQNSIPQINGPERLPPVTTPTTPSTTGTSRRTQSRPPLANRQAVERALPIQQSQRAEIQPQRMRQAALPQSGRISSPPKGPPPSLPVMDEPLPRFQVPPPPDQRPPRHESPGGLRRPIGRSPITRVDGDNIRDGATNPRSQQPADRATLDAYFDL